MQFGSFLQKPKCASGFASLPLNPVKYGNYPMITEITRLQLAAMTPRQRMDIVLGGQHAVISDPPRPKMKLPPGALTRAQFDALAPADRATAARSQRILDAEDFA
jgi:hypothetical protein